MSTNKYLWIAAGIGVAGFVGYCISFDRKRRNDPLYREKVKQRRKEQQKLRESTNGQKTKFPDPRDVETMQQFLIQEISAGEELVKQGDNQAAVKHFINALTVCGQPQQLLQLFQQALPPEVIEMIIQELPKIGKERQAQPTPSFSDGID